MIKQPTPGVYLLDYQLANGHTLVYRFRHGQEALAAHCIAEAHCRGRLPKHAAMLLLGAVRGIVARRVKRESLVVRLRRAVCAFVSREWTLLVAILTAASVSAERQLRMSRERRNFESRCSGK